MSLARFRVEAFEARVLLSAAEAVPETPAPDAEAGEAIETVESADFSAPTGAQDLLPFDWAEGISPEVLGPDQPEGGELSAAAVTGIPQQINPANGVTVLLPPGGFNISIPASSGGVAGLWRVALGAGPGPELLRARTTGPINAPVDLAIALYDADGNRLAIADDFGSGPGSFESLIAPNLPSERTYYLAVVSQGAVPGSTYSLTVELPEAQAQAPVVMNTLTGTGTYSAGSLATMFDSSSEYHFHPLNLLNVSDKLRVRVQPTIADSDLDFAVFRSLAATQLAGPSVVTRYALVASGSTSGGAVAELQLTNPAGGNFSEGDYVLTVAPKGLAARAGPYRVDIATDSPLLAPGRPDRTDLQSGLIMVQRPTENLGFAEAEWNDQILTNNVEERFYRFRSPSSTVRITVDANFNSIVTLYSNAGAAVLMELSTSSSAVDNSLTATVTPNDEYYIRVASTGGRSAGLTERFSVKLETTYSWRELAPNFNPSAAPGATTHGSIFPSAFAAPIFFRISPDPRVDYFTLHVGNTLPAAQIRISVQGNGFTEEVIAAGGAAAILPVRLIGRSGPLYVSFSTETGGAVNTLLVYGQLAVPRELPLESFPGRKQSIVTGNVLESGTFARYGSRVGFSYFQMLNAPNQNSTWTATGADGTLPLLVRYVEDGSVFRLVEDQVAGPTDTISWERNLPTERFYAMAAYKLAIGDGGSVSLLADNPTPLPVGVGMVPDLDYENRPEFQFGSISPIGSVASQYNFQVEPIRYGSILKIEPMTLEQDYEMHLWETLLLENFFNGTSTENPAWPVVRLAPESPNSDLQLRLTIYDGDGEQLRRTNGTVVGSFTSEPGQALHVSFASLGILRQPLIAAKLRFRVEAMPGQLGDGAYSLRMTVRTTNPHPYEPTETAWKFSGATVPYYLPGDGAQVGTFPAGTSVTDIPQNQFGDGGAIGQFNSSAVEVDVYRFWVPLNGALKVWTSPEGIDPANTSLKLYRPRFIVETEAQRNAWWKDLDYLGELRAGLTGITGNTDWFPADRSEIDSQVVISDPLIAQYAERFSGQPINPGTDPTNESQLALPYQPRDRPLTDGGYYVYAVVKNEQGSKGQYRIRVDAEDLPLVDNETVLLPNRPSASESRSVVNFDVPNVEAYRNFMGFIPIQMPDRHSGYLYVEGEANQSWEFQLYDSEGQALARQSLPTSNDVDRARFTVPAGKQALYLRVREGVVSNASATLRLETTLTQDAGLPTNFSQLNADALAQTQLPTDPWGDLNLGDLTEGVSIDSIGKVYRFSAPAGRLTVGVHLFPGTNVSVEWGIYGNGRLLSWDRSLPGDEDSQTTEILLPNTNLPGGSSSDFASSGRRHSLLLFVRHDSSSAAAGQYQITIDTHKRPEFIFSGSETIALPPTAEEASTVRAVDAGDRWLRVVVPDDLLGGMSVTELPTNANLYPLRYDLYNAGGTELITSGLRQERGNGVLTLSGVEGGKAYMLRVTPRNFEASFPVRLAYNLPKEASNPAPREVDLPVYDIRARPSINGDFNLSAAFGSKTRLWVLHDIDQAGPARFTATFEGSSQVRIAVYHARELTAEFPQVKLVDYTNETSVQNTPQGKVLVLDTFLHAGLHYIEITRSNTSAGEVTLVGDTTGYVAQQLVLDPNQGITMRENLGMVTGNNLGTLYFRVRAPAGSFGEATFTAIDLAHADSGMAGYTLRQGIMTVTKVTGGLFGPIGGISQIQTTTLNPGAASPEKATITTTTVAEPFTEYLIAIHGTGAVFRPLQDDLGRMGIFAHFPVPLSGTPDLVVESIALKPNGGQTLVEISVRNRGYATSFTNQARFSYPSLNPEEPIVADLFESTLGPQGRRVHLLDWIDPVSPDDITRYEVDVSGQIDELDETNNIISAAMKTVNAHRPTLGVVLGSGHDGNPDAGIWGRYVDSRSSNTARVRDDIIINAQDADDAANTYDNGPELYSIRNESPILYTTGTWIDRTQVILDNVALSDLAPSSSNNPHTLVAYAKDRFGLRSTDVVRYIEVVAFPGWLDGGDSALTFDEDSNEYQIEFNVETINYRKTLSQMLGINVPFVGDWQNEFLLTAKATGTASLNPNTPDFALNPSVHVKLTVLDEEIYDETFQSGVSLGANISVNGQVHLDGRTLEATQLQLGFALNNLFLGSFEGPEIPIFGFDAGVVAAAVQAQVLGSAYANAAVTMTFDLTGGGAPIALVSPTYIGLDLQMELRFEGELEVLGWDIASVGGGFIFTLKPKFGLEETPEPIAIDDFFSEACFELSATVGGELSADVLGVEVYSVEFESEPINFTNCDVDTMANSALTAHVAHTVHAAAVPPPITVTQSRPGGSAPVGTIESRPTPQLVVHPTSGEQLFAYLDYQMVDGQPGAPTLNFARGNDARFSAPVVLPTSEFIMSPVMAAANDGAGFRAVIAYQSAPHPTAATTRNEFFTSQDIVYRYYDGSQWSDEIVLTNDSLLDFEPVLAFNGAGRGVITWVKHSNAAPIGENGVIVGNGHNIYAAIWNPTTHRFGPPVRVDNQSGRDSRPTAFVSADGTHHLAWLADQIYMARSTGGAWSVSRPQIASLPTGDRLALGLGETNGNLTVFQVYQLRPVAHAPTKTYILATVIPQISVPTLPVEIVSETGGVSAFRVQTAPDGGMVLTWQERRGSFSDVVALRKPANSGNSSWALPARITQSAADERAPTVAIAPDGSYRVVFERGARPGASEGPALFVPTGSRGLLGSTRAALAPEVSFTSPLTFVEGPAAVIGGIATAETEILNSGNATAEITIRYEISPASPAGPPFFEQKITLRPGASYQIRVPLQVRAGENKLTIRLTTTTAEAFSTTNNTASAIIKGVADFAVALVNFLPVNYGANAPLIIDLVHRGGPAYNGPVELTTFWIDPAKPTQRTAVRTVTDNSISLVAGASVRRVVAIEVNRLGLTLAGVEAKFQGDELTLSNNAVFVSVDARPDVALIPVVTTIRDLEIVTPPIVISEVNSGGDATVAVVVSNPGNAPLQGFRLRILRTVDGGAAQELHNQIYTTKIEPGEHTGALPLKLKALAGRNVFRAIVELLPADAPKAGEPNPANNSAIAIVQVQALPDLVVVAVRSSVAGTPPQVRQGQSMRVDADIRNTGIAAASNVLVEVFATGARGVGGILVGRAVIDRVDPLATRTVQIAIDTGKLEIDTQNLRVVIDRHARVLESNDRNNEATLRIAVLPPVVQSTGHYFNTGAAQLSQVSSVSFTFNRDLRTNITAGSVEIIDLVTGETVGPSNLGLLVLGTERRVVVTFPGLKDGKLPPGEYEARLNARSIADTSGNALTRDVVVRFVITPGDANGDGRTNDRDFLFVWQQTRKSEAARNLSADVNGDGKVDLLDLDFVKSNYARAGAQLANIVL